MVFGHFGFSTAEKYSRNFFLNRFSSSEFDFLRMFQLDVLNILRIFNAYFSRRATNTSNEFNNNECLGSIFPSRVDAGI